MKSDFYFTICATENEHSIIERIIRDACNNREIKVEYYRKLETGHVPTYRECKILASPAISKKLLSDLDIKYGNYWND